MDGASAGPRGSRPCAQRDKKSLRKNWALVSGRKRFPRGKAAAAEGLLDEAQAAGRDELWGGGPRRGSSPCSCGEGGVPGRQGGERGPLCRSGWGCQRAGTRC